MDATWFDALPMLCKNRKHVVEEIHVLLCPSPRPVAIKIGAGYRKLPEDMWPMGELAARALQGVETHEVEACLIGGFLAQILCQAIREAGILETSPCMDGRALLSLLLAKAKPAETTMQQRMPKRQIGAAAKNAPHAKEECSDAAPTVVAENAPHANEECSEEPPGTVTENAANANEERRDAAPGVVTENAAHTNEECSDAAPNVVAENAPHANEECNDEAPGVVGENAPHANEECSDEAHSVVGENATLAKEECNEEAPAVVAENAPHANEECSDAAPSDLAEHAQHENEPSGDGCHEGKKPETAKQRRRRMHRERKRRMA